MSESYLTYAMFFAVCLLLLTLPFVPAFMEWLRPTDSMALPISAAYTSDIDHFARRLHADASAKLGSGASTGYEDFDFVVGPIEAMDLRKAPKRLIAPDISCREAIHCGPALYVDGSIKAGAGSTFSALYATGSIELEPKSEIYDWGHADGVLTLNNGSVALRRISSATAVVLGNETWFERVQAPTVYFGSGKNRATFPWPAVKAEASYGDLPGVVQQTPVLFLVRGDCTLTPGSIYRGSLVVTGFLVVGQGTIVVGDVKARDGITIAKNAEVQGALTCEKRVYLFNASRVFGPLVSEGDLLIGASAVVGLADAQTTVSARNIIVEDGVLVHGAIWAHEIGMVKAA